MTSKTLHFRVGELEAANALVRQYHYSKRPPTNVHWVGTWHEDGGLFGDYGPVVAACFISISSSKWNELLYELTRLVRAPHVTKPLTGLISATLKHAAKNGADLVISFADKGQNHFGGIY